MTEVTTRKLRGKQVIQSGRKEISMTRPEFSSAVGQLWEYIMQNGEVIDEGDAEIPGETRKIAIEKPSCDLHIGEIFEDFGAELGILGMAARADLIAYPFLDGPKVMSIELFRRNSEGSIAEKASIVLKYLTDGEVEIHLLPPFGRGKCYPRILVTDSRSLIVQTGVRVLREIQSSIQAD